MRGLPLSERKAALAQSTEEGQARYPLQRAPQRRRRGCIFEHACMMGLEGIVSKRLNSPYRSGKVNTWLKTKNPKAAAVLRVQEAAFTG